MSPRLGYAEEVAAPAHVSRKVPYMKKNEPTRKIRLNRETLRALEQSELTSVAGQQPVTTATIRTCCIPATTDC
jgi:hypothetical protein